MPKQPYAKGVTLTETLITLAIVGLVLIPTLLTSSAYFSSRIIKVREQLGLSHDVSLMLQQLSTELAQSPKLLLPTSEDNYTPATELRYSYRDPMRNEQRYGGLRLIDSNGRRQVQALTYNGTAWEAYSPYRSHPSTAFTLAASAVFDYCNDTACSLTPDQATFVKINNWTFRNEANLAQTLPLAELRLVVGSQLTEAEGQLAADKALLLYTVDTSQSMEDFTVNGQTLHLDPTNRTLAALPYDLSEGTASTGLQTILASQTGITQSIAVDNARGHFFFSDTNQRTYFYKASSGTLSTIISSFDVFTSMFISPNTGRLYIGSRDDETRPLRVYNPNTGVLTTLLAPDSGNVLASGQYFVDTARGLLYFTRNNAMNMYNENTNTLVTIPIGNAYFYGSPFQINEDTGCLFIGRGLSTSDGRTTRINLWCPNVAGNGGTLTTLANGLDRPGRHYSIWPVGGAQNRVIFGDHDGLYYWENGQSGLSTIFKSSSTRPGQYDDIYVQPRTPSALAQWPASAQLDKTNTRFYFYVSGLNRGTYAYNYLTHTLTTLTPTGTSYGKNSLVLDSSTGDLYIGNDTILEDTVWKYNPVSGTLTTLTTGIDHANTTLRLFTTPKMLVVPSSLNNVFNLYKLLNNSLLTLPITGTGVGSNNLFDQGTQEVLFAASSGANGYFSYSALSGLHTLIAPGVLPSGSYGALARTGIDTNRKLILLTSSEANRPAYILDYNRPNPAAVAGNFKIAKANVNGIPQDHGLVNIADGKTYTAMATDADNTLYLLNTTDGTLEHYTYYTSTKTHNLTGSGTLNASYYTTGSALALDEANTAIWLLQPTSKTLYQFANRKATGALTPAATVSVNQNTTPTGIAIDQRTGYLYVIDSNKTGNNITLRRYNAAGAYLGASHDVAIDVSATGLGAGNAATTETAFRIEIDEIGNILYLIAPNLGKVYAFSMPLFKDS
jgi:hypothetical protein